MTRYDLCLAWNWEYDADFVALLDSACQARGLSLLQITPANLTHTIESLVNEELTFSVFLDRASEDDCRFMPIVEWARSQHLFCINPHELAYRSCDKAAMHVTLSRSVYTPRTIVVPSYSEQPDLPPIDVSLLGPDFIIKPAHGSGGAGVIPVATSFEQVLAARRQFPDDKYLLQARIVPIRLDSQPAWFRVIYSMRQLYPCWWETDTHVYTPVTPAQERDYDLAPLYHIAESIARICRLHLFSTEIALTADNSFVVVDYANDTLDLRLQSKTPEGVPDHIVHLVVESLATFVADHLPAR